MTNSKICPYGHHARLSRDLADHLADSETRSHLLAMASLYERLARISAERGLELRRSGFSTA